MTLLVIVCRLWEAEKATLNEQLQTLKHMQSNRIATPQDTIDNMQTLHATLCDNRGSEDSLELVAASLRQELDESHEKEVKTGHMYFCSEVLQNERNPCRYCKDLLPVTSNAGFLRCQCLDGTIYSWKSLIPCVGLDDIDLCIHLV